MGVLVRAFFFLRASLSLSHLPSPSLPHAPRPDEYVLRCQLFSLVLFPSHLFVQRNKPAVIHPCLVPAAALIRGNRNNCTQFSNNLDWLVSKLERLESSSGALIIILKQTAPPLKQHCNIYPFTRHSRTGDMNLKKTKDKSHIPLLSS